MWFLLVWHIIWDGSPFIHLWAPHHLAVRDIFQARKRSKVHHQFSYSCHMCSFQHQFCTFYFVLLLAASVSYYYIFCFQRLLLHLRWKLISKNLFWTLFRLDLYEVILGTVDLPISIITLKFVCEHAQIFFNFCLMRTWTPFLFQCHCWFLKY